MLRRRRSNKSFVDSVESRSKSAESVESSDERSVSSVPKTARIRRGSVKLVSAVAERETDFRMAAIQANMVRDPGRRDIHARHKSDDPEAVRDPKHDSDVGQNPQSSVGKSSGFLPNHGMDHHEVHAHVRDSVSPTSANSRMERRNPERNLHHKQRSDQNMIMEPRLRSRSSTLVEASVVKTKTVIVLSLAIARATAR